jgi:hypothetical protein
MASFPISVTARSQVFLLKCAFESEKVEQIGIAEHQIGSHPIFFPQGLQFQFRQLSRLPGKGGALVKHGSDFLLESAGAPPFHPAHFGVELALKGFRQVYDGEKMGPAQLSHQRRDNSFIGKRISESDHVAQALFGKSPSVLGRQLSRQCRDNFRPVLRPRALEYLPVDPPADPPIQHGQPGIHRNGHGSAGFLDHLPDVAK